jgi:hypothetical protein
MEIYTMSDSAILSVKAAERKARELHQTKISERELAYGTAIRTLKDILNIASDQYNTPLSLGDQTWRTNNNKQFEDITYRTFPLYQQMKILGGILGTWSSYCSDVEIKHDGRRYGHNGITISFFRPSSGNHELDRLRNKHFLSAFARLTDDGRKLGEELSWALGEAIQNRKVPFLKPQP